MFTRMRHCSWEVCQGKLWKEPDSKSAAKFSAKGCAYLAGAAADVLELNRRKLYGI